MIALSSARLAAYLLTSLVRLSSRSTMLFFAMIPPLFLEREVQRAEQRATFFIGFGGGGDGDIQTTDPIDLIIFDLRKDDLLTHPHRVVATTVEGLRVETTEVTNTGDRDIHQAIEKVPHALGAQGHLDPDRPAFTHLEARDGLACLGHQRLLTGELLQIADGVVDQLLVAGR